MTAPLNTWMRSLAPSMTFTCTLTVSPGPKTGMSSRSDALSTKSSVFISEDTSLQVARPRDRGARSGVADGQRTDGSGMVVVVGDRRATPTRRELPRQLLNCARRHRRDEIHAGRPTGAATRRRIAAPRGGRVLPPPPTRMINLMLSVGSHSEEE